MDIKELIEELNSWKAPYADITVCGADIDRVTNIGANTFSIEPKTDWSVDDRIEELESELNDKQSDINSLEDEVSDYEDFVDDLKADMRAAVSILEDLEDADPRILKIIDKFEDDINKEIY